MTYTKDRSVLVPPDTAIQPPPDTPNQPANTLTHTNTHTHSSAANYLTVDAGELVVHTKNTALESQKLSTTDHSYHMDGWLLGARLCICPEIFLELKSVQTLKKKYIKNCWVRPWSPQAKDHIHTLKIMFSLSEFTGRWKQRKTTTTNKIKTACIKRSMSSKCSNWTLLCRWRRGEEEDCLGGSWGGGGGIWKERW